MRLLLLSVALAGAVYLCAKSARSQETAIGPYRAYPTFGTASWYADEFSASGVSFQEDPLFCAMRRNDYGGYYKVCNPENQKCVIVRQIDYGPRLDLYKQGRIVDLSKEAFGMLADPRTGLVRVTVVPWASPIDRAPDKR